MEAMPKTIERTLSGSETAPPFHRTRRISLNYYAVYFFRKDGVCVALAYFFPGRVRRLFLPGTLQVRSKHVNDTVRYGNFFWAATVHVQPSEHVNEKEIILMWRTLINPLGACVAVGQVNSWETTCTIHTVLGEGYSLLL